jgi:hypothetical protein
MKHVLHISTRTDKMLCGVPDVSGVWRRYLSDERENRDPIAVPCQKCAEREPLAFLKLVLDNPPCWWECGRPGTHVASYDGRWTCEQCVV